MIEVFLLLSYFIGILNGAKILLQTSELEQFDADIIPKTLHGYLHKSDELIFINSTGSIVTDFNNYNSYQIIQNGSWDQDDNFLYPNGSWDQDDKPLYHIYIPASPRKIIEDDDEDPMEEYLNETYSEDTPFLSRDTRVPRKCRIPDYLRHSSLRCQVHRDKLVCIQKCIWGHTFRKRIKRKIVCCGYCAYWRSRYTKHLRRHQMDCKPYVDCGIKIKTGGKKICYTNFIKKPTFCKISCDGRRPRKYRCNLRGRWSPRLPHCARPGSNIKLCPPPRGRLIDGGGKDSRRKHWRRKPSRRRPSKRRKRPKDSEGRDHDSSDSSVDSDDRSLKKPPKGRRRPTPRGKRRKTKPPRGGKLRRRTTPRGRGGIGKRTRRPNGKDPGPPTGIDPRPPFDKDPSGHGETSPDADGTGDDGGVSHGEGEMTTEKIPEKKKERTPKGDDNEKHPTEVTQVTLDITQKKTNGAGGEQTTPMGGDVSKVTEGVGRGSSGGAEGTPATGHNPSGGGGESTTPLVSNSPNSSDKGDGTGGTTGGGATSGAASDGGGGGNSGGGDSGTTPLGQTPGTGSDVTAGSTPG